MENPIKLIHKFNKEAGLIDQGYDDFLESSFQIEEALEGFDTSNLYRVLLESESRAPNEVPTQNTPKELSRAIVNTTNWSESKMSDVDRLDKAADAVVFAVGSMAKLGLNPQEITKALNVVMHKNFEKLKCPKDEFGKLTKPADFIGPEPLLQEILDSRGKK